MTKNLNLHQRGQGTPAAGQSETLCLAILTMYGTDSCMTNRQHRPDLFNLSEQTITISRFPHC